MAQRRRTAAPDPLSSASEEEANDPLSDIGGADEVDPLADVDEDEEEAEEEDPFADIEDEPAPVKPTTKGKVTAEAVRKSLPASTGGDPLILQGIQEIQSGLGKVTKLAADFDKLQSCMVNCNKHNAETQKLVESLIAKQEAGFASILGALQELREHSGKATTPPQSATTTKGEKAAPAGTKNVDNQILKILLKSLKERRDKKPNFRLVLNNPEVVWGALSKELANLGVTLTAKGVEELVKGAGLVRDNEVHF